MTNNRRISRGWLSRALALALLIGTAQSGFGVGFNVTFLDGPGEGFNDPNLGADRQAAFRFALDIWSGVIVGDVTIEVEASFDPLGGTQFGATLAFAGPQAFVSDFANAPLPGTVYSIPQAINLAGVNLTPGDAHIGVTANSDVDGNIVLGEITWYYGTDAMPPENDVDFVTTILHELGHGLGFLDLIDEQTGDWAFRLPDIFSRQLIQPSVGPVDAMTNPQRFRSLTSNELFWKGPNVVTAKNGFVQMFAPRIFQIGSSISHWDTSNTPDLLMEPFDTGPKHDVDITREAFIDIGWETTNLTPVATFTPSFTRTPTPTRTPTFTVTPTPSVTNTPTITLTPSNTFTPTPTFTPRVTMSFALREEVGEGPVSVAAGDLDGVNFDDIVTGNRAGDSISILLNNGGGSFPADPISVSTGLGSRPSFVSLGDINSDSLTDVMAVLLGTNQVGSLVRIPSEKGLPVDIGENSYMLEIFSNLDVDVPISLFTADLNGDDRTDLAVANSEGDDLTIALAPAVADQIFDETGERVSVSGQLPVFVTGGILRPGAQTVDLVVANWEDSTVSVLLGDGSGGFASPDVYPVGVNPRHIVIADLDNDNDNDLVVVNNGAPQVRPPIEGSITLLFNEGGTGQFVIPSNGELSPGVAPAAAAAFDIDKNGFNDLAIVNQGSPFGTGDLILFYNDAQPGGPAVFRVFDRFPNFGDRPLGIVSASLNSALPPHDANAPSDDLVVADPGGDRVEIVMITNDPAPGKSSSDLNLDAQADYLDLFLYSVVSARKDALIRSIADLTNDGFLDGGDLVTLLKLKNAPAPKSPQYQGRSALPKGIAPPSPGDVGDVDGDGVIDLRDFLCLSP